MKNMVIALALAFAATALHAQGGPPLKQGMPHTLNLPGGDVVYDLKGDWDAVFDTGGWGTYEDVVRISQEGNQFVGTYLNKGDNHFSKGDSKVMGTLRGNGFEEIKMHVNKPEQGTFVWAIAEGTISGDCNTIICSRTSEFKGAKTTQTLTLTRK